MKPILAFLVAFVVASGASTGVKVMLTKPAPPKHALADSTKEAVSPTESASPRPVASLDKAAGFSPSSTLVNTGIKPVAKVAAAPAAKAPAPRAAPAAASPAPTATPTVDSVAEASERRLAKVFTAMEPKQAAKVLAHMDNNDVQIILGYVGPRQAASIMAELPAERVATLSKLAMQSKVK